MPARVMLHFGMSIIQDRWRFVGEDRVDMTEET